MEEETKQLINKYHDVESKNTISSLIAKRNVSLAVKGGSDALIRSSSSLTSYGYGRRYGCGNDNNFFGKVQCSTCTRRHYHRQPSLTKTRDQQCCTDNGRRNFGTTGINRAYPHLDRTVLKGEFGSYLDEYQESIQSPEAFWKEAAAALSWFRKPETAIETDPDKPYLTRHFPDGAV